MTSMTNVVAGCVSVLFGLTFMILNRGLAVIAENGNKKWFGLPFPLSSSEWGFKVAGIVLTIFGVALAVGLLRIAK